MKSATGKLSSPVLLFKSKAESWLCVLGVGNVSSAALLPTEVMVILLDEYLLIHSYSCVFYFLGQHSSLIITLLRQCF